MKIFQIVNGFCHWATPYISLEQVKGKYPPDVLFVEAPDCVFEGWGYDDGNFIKPEPPDGFLYDEETGTFYSEKDKEQVEAQRKGNIHNKRKYNINDIVYKYSLQQQLMLIADEIAKIEALQGLPQGKAFAEYVDFLKMFKDEDSTESKETDKNEGETNAVQNRK